jgi:serine/threonine-protein kinase RsbW
VARKRLREIVLRIPMIPNMELTASQVAKAVADLISLPRDQADEVRLAIIEACLNAFEHSASPDGVVTLRYSVDPDRLTIQIEDHGSGFDPAAAGGEGPSEKRPLQVRGWGLTLMREFMDEVRIESGPEGTRVTLIKNLGPGEGE